MNTFGLIMTFLTLFILLVDKVFISSPKVIRSLAVFYGFVLVFIWFNKPFESASQILGVGRSVDILIYLALFVLIREFVLSRQRYYDSNRQMTQLVREIALMQVQRKAPENEK